MSKISDDYTIEGLVSNDALKSAATERNRKVETKTVSAEPVFLDKHLSKGWNVVKKNKDGSVKISKDKDPWALFENQIWMLFYRMGFEELNGRSDTFEIYRDDTKGTKQIDVYAKTGNTICVIECKSTEKPNTLSSSSSIIHDAINEISTLQGKGNIKESIRKHYNSINKNRENYKIVWILALKNYVLSDGDKEAAKSQNIFILEDSAIQYFEQLTKQFGNTAKNIFLGTLFPHGSIPGEKTTIPAIRGKMGKYTYYSFSVSPEKLLRISCLAHRHRGNTKVTSLETYQRIAKKKRMDAIAAYIKEGGKEGGVFPTSIVVNFSSNNIQFKEIANQKGCASKIGYLTLPQEYESAWIIDGQHRLYAYANLPEEASSASLPVIAFENLEAATQAKFFVDINGKQEKVESTLLNEIKASILKDSSKGKDRLEAIYSQITLDLNTNKASPFFNRIIEANSSRNGKYVSITNNTIIDELKKSHLIGKFNQQKPSDIYRGPLFKFTFEDTCKYVEDIICDYYNLFLGNAVLKEQWDRGKEEEGFLCTNHGIKSTLRVLTHIINHLNGITSKDGKFLNSLSSKEITQKVKPFIEPLINYIANAPMKELIAMRHSSGEGGVKMTTDKFVATINEKYPDFQPEIAKEYRQKYASENRVRNNDGKKLGDEIEKKLRNAVIEILTDTFGSDVSEWWGKGVPKKVKETVVSIANDEGVYEPQRYGDYLSFSTIKSIVSDKDLFEIFADKFTINAKEKDPKKKKLGWIAKCDELKANYSIDDGEIISEEDLLFLKGISEEISKRFS